MTPLRDSKGRFVRDPLTSPITIDPNAPTPIWDSIIAETETTDTTPTVIATGWRAWVLVALIVAVFVALIVLGVTTAGTSGLPVALTMWMLAIIGGVATIAAVKEAEK